MIDFLELVKEVGDFSATDVLKLQTILDDRKFVLGISKYSEGRIYGIWDKVTGELAYVGSTIKLLPNRWSGHKSHFKNNPDSSYTRYIMSHGGPSKFEIKLIEAFPCKTFKDLLNRERYHINDLKPVCNVSMVNKPGQVQDDENEDDDEDNEEVCMNRPG